MKHDIVDNIVLIGMSGAGKSTLGVLLAKARGMDFTDTDILLQQQEHRLLQEIIDEDGSENFLKIEETVVSGLIVHNCVIATGGSVVYSEKAMTALKREGMVVYLYVPYEELIKRLTNITTRGIVMRAGSSLKDVYKDRLPLYKKYSDCTIDCSRMDIEQCVQTIIAQL
jgi:shikimate kinase